MSRRATWEPPGDDLEPGENPTVSAGGRTMRGALASVYRQDPSVVGQDGGSGVEHPAQQLRLVGVVLTSRHDRYARRPQGASPVYASCSRSGGHDHHPATYTCTDRSGRHGYVGDRCLGCRTLLPILGACLNRPTRRAAVPCARSSPFPATGAVSCQRRRLLAVAAMANWVQHGTWPVHQLLPVARVNCLSELASWLRSPRR